MTPPMKRAMIRVNGLNLFYRDTLVGDQTILCLHGMFGRGETWSDLIERYSAKYRLIAPDQRGHGLSDKPVARYAAEDFAADAYALIQQLNCGPVIVVGHSMGGKVAGYLAACYPEAVKALVILDMGINGPETLSTLPPEQVSPANSLTADWPLPYPTYEAALQHLAQRYAYPSNRRYFLESLTETVEGYNFLFSRYSMAAMSEYHYQWQHVLPQLQCPTLLVRATESWCMSEDEAQRMCKLIKHLTYFEISRSDPMVYADNPEEFYPRFEQFLFAQ